MKSLTRDGLGARQADDEAAAVVVATSGRRPLPTVAQVPRIPLVKPLVVVAMLSAPKLMVAPVLRVMAPICSTAVPPPARVTAEAPAFRVVEATISVCEPPVRLSACRPPA